MSTTPSVRSIREALHELARSHPPDAVAVEALRADAAACVLGMRRSIDRAFDFAGRGLVSEAVSIIEDYPELVQQAHALHQLVSADPTTGPAWRTLVESARRGLPVPQSEEVDRLAGILTRAQSTRELLDALRTAVLRQEPLVARLRILRRLRAADQGNRLWLDQLESLEREWLRRIAGLREGDPSRAELEEALVALERHEWVAAVPRGLRDEIHARLRPLRADEALGRYLALADAIHDAASMMDRAELERLEVEWVEVERDTGRMPGEALLARVRPAFEWLTRVAQEDESARAFDALVERLERSLDEERPPVEIERNLAALRDAGRSAPEGVVARAEQFLAAARDRASRRNRLVIGASLAAALAVAIVGAYLLRAFAMAQSEAADIAALREAIAAKDAPRARALAGELAQRHPEPGVAMSTALAEHAAFDAADAARASATRAALAGFERELSSDSTAIVSRARLVALKGLIAAESSGASEGERAGFARVEELRVARLAALDAADSTRVDAALAAAESALRGWPLPEKWRDAEQLDAARWQRYESALGEAQATLEACAAAVAGYESGARRVALAQEGVAARLGESVSRREAIAAAARDLAPEKIAASVTAEGDLVRRLEAALQSHGAHLARSGQLAGYEAARDCAAAWASLAAWRLDYRPRLVAILGDDLAARVAPDRIAECRVILDDYLAKHGSTPLRGSLLLLSRRFEPQAVAATMSPDSLLELLGTTPIAGIDEVPLVDGRRFYRRPSRSGAPSQAELNPLNRALVSRADLSAPEESLRSILEVRRDEIGGAARPNAVSRAWSRAQSRLAAATPAETGEILVGLAGEILAAKESDPLLRLSALQSAALAIERSGSASDAFLRGLAQWRRTVAAEADGVSEIDWLRAGFAPASEHAESRGAAERVLAAFPKIDEVRDESRQTSDRFARELGPLVPVGVLAPATDASGARTLGAGGYTGPVQLVRAMGSTFTLVETPCTEGRVATSGLGIPAGPVVVYRRIKQ